MEAASRFATLIVAADEITAGSTRRLLLTIDAPRRCQTVWTGSKIRKYYAPRNLPAAIDRPRNGTRD
jgi:hypothetical protein